MLSGEVKMWIDEEKEKGQDALIVLNHDVKELAKLMCDLINHGGLDVAYVDGGIHISWDIGDNHNE